MPLPRVLTREQFDAMFMTLYPALVKARKPDLVHDVYVLAIEREAWKALTRNQKQFKAWVLAEIKYLDNVMVRVEKQEFGKRRVNERD